jgi:hypothetical protein
LTRVPASLALLALRQSGYRITAATLRSWTHRGHITRTREGYSLTEIVTYLDKRAEPKTREVTPCLADGCDSPSVARKYCNKHYRRFKTHGDPLIGATKEPGYDGVHHRLRANRGNADTHTCEFCGFPAVDWAYDHDDPEELTDERGRVFSRDPEHYMPLCRICHRTFDARHAKRAGHRCIS